MGRVNKNRSICYMKRAFHIETYLSSKKQLLEKIKMNLAICHYESVVIHNESMFTHQLTVQYLKIYSFVNHTSFRITSNLEEMFTRSVLRGE